MLVRTNGYSMSHEWILQVQEMAHPFKLPRQPG